MLPKLRLDFNTMVIAGPSTSSASVGRTRGGAFGSPKSYNRVATKGQCITDSFSVTNPGGHSPPVICGTNSGDHSKWEWTTARCCPAKLIVPLFASPTVYVDASGMCNQLIFQMSSISIQSPLVFRQWAITVTTKNIQDGLAGYLNNYECTSSPDNPIPLWWLE